MVSNCSKGPVLLGMAPIFPCFSKHDLFYGNSESHAHQYQGLKPQAQGKLYKAIDRDGLCVAVTTAGPISFRYSYSINGGQESISFGCYGLEGGACG